MRRLQQRGPDAADNRSGGPGSSGTGGCDSVGGTFTPPILHVQLAVCDFYALGPKRPM